MLTVPGAEGWAMMKHNRNDVKPPSWAPNLGRICDAFLFYQQSMPAAWDLDFHCQVTCAEYSPEG